MTDQHVLLFHCLHCGRVIHLEAEEASAPECCGVDMTNAAESNAATESTNHDSDTAELYHSLEVFERSLETPRVPGELERWLADVRANLQAAARLVKRQIGQNHEDLLRQIAREDPDLHSRVGRLKIGDEESADSLDKLQEWIGRLEVAAPRVEPDERRLEEEVAGFVKQCLDFIIHARKQEVAIDTWLQEALHRDRGVGD